MGGTFNPYYKAPKLPTPGKNISKGAPVGPQGPSLLAHQGPVGPQGIILPPPSSPGGVTGFLGGLAHQVNYGLGQAGHGIAVGAHGVNVADHATQNFITGSADKAAHDIAAMPTGVANLVNTDVVQPWKNLFTTGHPYAHGQGKKIDKLTDTMIKSTAESLVHPGRDPFQTLLNYGALGAGAASLASRAGAAAGAVSDATDASIFSKAGEAAKAFAKKPESAPRFVQVPKIVKGKIKNEPVQLTAAGKPLPRALQAAHDKIIEGSMSRRAQAVAEGTAKERTTPLLKYGQKRVGYSINETSRRAEQASGALPTQLDRIARTGTGKLWNRGFGNGLTKNEGNLALILRASNLLPHEIRNFWNKTVMDAINPALVQHLADTAHSLHEKGVLSMKRGKVVINPGFDTLQNVDNWVKKGQSVREDIVRKNGRLDPQTMQNRLDLVSKTVLGDLHDGRKGQGFFTLKATTKELPKYPRSASSSRTGRVKDFILRTKHATGKGIGEGIIPANMVHSVAHTTREALQYANKLRYRKVVARYGSDVKVGRNDVLVLDHNAKSWATKLTAKEMLSLGTHADVTLDPLDQASINAAIEAHLNDLFPFRSADHPLSGLKSSTIGDKAPKGYTWVPKRYLGDAVKPTEPMSTIGKVFSIVNQAVTAITVYFKLSHIPQRFLTDATTSAVSGSLFSRKSLSLAMSLHKEMDQNDFLRATASTGTHGYTALPKGEGALDLQNVVGRAATRGSSFYARNLDAPFRYLNLVHEARKAGILSGTATTAENATKFNKFLDYAENPSGRFTAAEKAKYEQTYRRANSVSMAYDRMSTGERNTIARGLWFYPWVKASTTYGGHVVAERPFLAAAGANAGVEGRKVQQKVFGDIPSFAYGMVPFGKDKTTQPGYLFPFQTGGQSLEAVTHPGQILTNNLNPVWASVLAAGGFGRPANPVLGTSAGAQGVGALLGSTPEWRMIADALNPSYANKSTHLFPHTALDDFFSTFLGGPSFPRKTNKKALHFDWGLEHGKYKQIYIPSGK